MKTIPSTLLADRRSEFLRRIERSVGQDRLIAAFAWFWLPNYAFTKDALEAALVHAMEAKGAARTFREIAVLGFAIMGGRKDVEMTDSFVAGVGQLAGRAFQIAGMHAPVCDDCIALLGLSMGIKSTVVDPAVKVWISEALRIGATRQGITECDRNLIDLSKQLVVGGPASAVQFPPLLLAAISVGIIQPGDDAETVSRAFLTSYFCNSNGSNEHAILCVSSFDWLWRSAPSVDLKFATMQAVFDILNRMGASLHRWVFETEPKTKGAVARQWHIDNEYHVQSLLWAVLSPVFPDLRDEEWLMSVGQRKPRADLCLLGLRLIIEVKFLRTRTKAQDIIEEIAADTSLYLAHGSPYSSIIVFIWDDTASSDQHHVLANGIKGLKGVFGVIIESRPSRFVRTSSGTKKIKK